MSLPEPVARPRRWNLAAGVPIVGGAYWLLAHGGAWLFWGAVPGTVMLATGVAMLLWPGDRRINQYLALAAVLGVLVALPAAFSGGLVSAIAAGLLSAASFLVAGAETHRGMDVPEGVPRVDGDVAVWDKVGVDEALMGYFIASAEVPSDRKADTVCAELLEARELIVARGWYRKPEKLHAEPEAPSHVRVERHSIYGFEYESLRFASAYALDRSIPGAERWAAYHENDQCAAWVMRHNADRPWLMCIHGYRMGNPWLDFRLFDPRWLHQRLGFNLICPILPLHGPRKHGWRSGDEYLDGDFMDVFHAEVQALWDLRRTLAWLRMQEKNPRVGVMGFSLGGYNAALLAQYAEDLDFVIAGIPATDLSASLLANIPDLHRRYYESLGADETAFREVLHPVSPLARKPLVDAEHRHVFGGALDRIITPGEIPKLAEHWETEPVWYPGGHLSFRGEPAVSGLVRGAAERAGWQLPKREG